MDRIAENIVSVYPIFYKQLMSIEKHNQSVNPSASHYAILGMLSKHEMLPTSEIARGLYLSKPNMTSLIDRLIADGKVKRLPDKNDRRVINIRITEKGRTFLNGSRNVFKENMKKRLRNLSEEDISLLYGSLENIRHIITRLKQQGSDRNEAEH